MGKTRAEYDAKLRQIQNYVNKYQHVLRDLLFTDDVRHLIDGIKLAEEDQHWDAAYDLADDLLLFYRAEARARVRKDLRWLG